MAREDGFTPLFEESCWVFDADNDRWIMPLGGRAPAIKADIIRAAFFDKDDKEQLIKAMKSLREKYSSSVDLIDPILERLETKLNKPG